MSEPVDPSSRPLDELDERYAAHDASLGNQLALSLTPATSARSEDPSRTPQGTAGDGAGHDVDVDLRSHLRMLRRRWKVVAAVTVVIVALAVGWSLAQPERYRAGVDLLIGSSLSQTVLDDASNPSTAPQVQRQLNNELERLESDAVVSVVADRYDGPLDPGDVEVTARAADSDVVTLSIESTRAEETAELLNTYAAAYIDVRRTTDVAALLDAGSKVQERLADVEATLAEVNQPLADLDAFVLAAPDDEGLRERRDELRATLAGEISALESQRTYFAQQLESLQLSAQLAGQGGAEVLSEATVPEDPFAPKPLRNGFLALVVGLAVAVAAAYLLEVLDERIRTPEDLTRATGGLPTLALVPALSIREPNEALLTRSSRAQPEGAEAFRSLRTSIRFAAASRPMRVLQVTSAIESEGKSLTAANLAAAFATEEHRVVVVDCDLRRPQVHTMFGEDLTPGLTDVLAGVTTPGTAVRAEGGLLSVITAGTLPPNPAELLATSHLEALIRSLAESFDLVVLDCSPVLPATDALVVSRLADATILVANSRRTTRNALRRTLEQLHHVGAPVLGVVLNMAPSDGTYGYGNAYASVAPVSGARDRAASTSG